MAGFTEVVYGQESQARANWKRTEEHFKRQKEEFADKIDKLEKQSPTYQARQSTYDGRRPQQPWASPSGQFLVPTEVVQIYGQMPQAPFPALPYQGNSPYPSYRQGHQSYGQGGRYQGNFTEGSRNFNPNNYRSREQQNLSSPKIESTSQITGESKTKQPGDQETDTVHPQADYQQGSRPYGQYNRNYNNGRQFSNNFPNRNIQQARVFFTKPEAPGWEMVDGHTLAQMANVFQANPVDMDEHEQYEAFHAGNSDSGNEPGGR